MAAGVEVEGRAARLSVSWKALGLLSLQSHVLGKVGFCCAILCSFQGISIKIRFQLENNTKRVKCVYLFHTPIKPH